MQRWKRSTTRPAAKLDGKHETAQLSGGAGRVAGREMEEMRSEQFGRAGALSRGRRLDVRTTEEGPDDPHAVLASRSPLPRRDSDPIEQIKLCHVRNTISVCHDCFLPSKVPCRTPANEYARMRNRRLSRAI